MNNKTTPTQYHTENYKTLIAEFTNQRDALKLSDVISYPTILLKRCDILLWDFIADYFSPDDKKELKDDIEHCWETVRAKIFTINYQLRQALDMLCECVGYVPEECKNG